MKYTDFDDYCMKQIVMGTNKAVRRRTFENMEKYCLGLHDAFDEAARHLSKPGTELYKAWYSGDLRKYIPSAVIPEYLDFEKYPLRYEAQ